MYIRTLTRKNHSILSLLVVDACSPVFDLEESDVSIVSLVSPLTPLTSLLLDLNPAAIHLKAATELSSIGTLIGRNRGM